MTLPMSGIGQGRMRGLRGLFRDRKAAVSVLGALALPSVIGASALAVELGAGYNARVENQRVADLAALSAALAYVDQQRNPTTVRDDVIQGTAAAIAANAGIPSTQVNATKTGNRINVVITSSVRLRLAGLIFPRATYNINSLGIATITYQAPVAGSPGRSTTSPVGCIMAMKSGGTGVSLTGGTTVNASGCPVIANGGVSLTSGTTLNVESVTAGGAVYDQAAQWNSPGIRKTGTITQNAGTPAVDPLADNSVLNAAFGKLGSFTAPTLPAIPTGTDLTGIWSSGLTFNGKTATWANNTHTFPPGTYNIRNLTNQGGMTIVFQGPGTVVTVSGTVSFGAQVKVEDGDVTFGQSLSIPGGSTLSLGKGGHNFGGNLTLGGGSTVTIGAGNVNIVGGIDQSGGGNLTFGAGDYAIGKLSSGNAINQGGGARMTFGNGAFSANGNIVTAGGTYLTFGQTAYHYVNGNMNLSGNAVLGSGFYIVNGNFTNGTGGYMNGVDITLVLAGTMQMSGGTSLNLAAPVVGSPWGVPQILVATRSTAQTTISGGSNNIYSGVFYAPNSDLVLSGGASIGSGTTGGNCLMMIVGTLSLSGGTSTTTKCSSITGVTRIEPGSQTQATPEAVSISLDQ
jgi:hypothetical protein